MKLITDCNYYLYKHKHYLKCLKWKIISKIFQLAWKENLSSTSEQFKDWKQFWSIVLTLQPGLQMRQKWQIKMKLKFFSTNNHDALLNNIKLLNLKLIKKSSKNYTFPKFLTLNHMERKVQFNFRLFTSHRIDKIRTKKATSFEYVKEPINLLNLRIA